MKKLLIFVAAYPVIALLALRLGAVLSGMAGIVEFFTEARPVLVVTTLAAGFSIGSYLLSAVTGDYSWVDRLWSTLPVAFAWIYAVRAGLAVAPTVAAILVTAWGLRLSYNFARRGGFTTIEDYRWPILRERIGSPLLWQVFNLLFISGFQVALFVGFTAPVQRLATLDGPISTTMLVAGAAVFLLLLALETVADQQQWVFQNIKHGFLPSTPAPEWFATRELSADEGLAADLRRGFLTHGLFRFSRHPNYFGELGVWWALFLFAGVVGGGLVHWSGIGVIVLTLLFIGSTRFTEAISAARYPAYREYQAHTSAIVPWIPDATPGEENART